MDRDCSKEGPDRGSYSLTPRETGAWTLFARLIVAEVGIYECLASSERRSERVCGERCRPLGSRCVDGACPLPDLSVDASTLGLCLGTLTVAEGDCTRDPPEGPWFCLGDTDCPAGTAPRYDFRTRDYQGISAGCSDSYHEHLPCQWVDVTGLPPGGYTLRVSVNFERLPAESSYANNTIEVPLTLLYPTPCLPRERPRVAGIRDAGRSLGSPAPFQ